MCRNFVPQEFFYMPVNLLTNMFAFSSDERAFNIESYFRTESHTVEMWGSLQSLRLCEEALEGDENHAKSVSGSFRFLTVAAPLYPGPEESVSINIRYRNIMNVSTSLFRHWHRFTPPIAITTQTSFRDEEPKCCEWFSNVGGAPVPSGSILAPCRGEFHVGKISVSLFPPPTSREMRSDPPNEEPHKTIADLKSDSSSLLTGERRVVRCRRTGFLSIFVALCYLCHFIIFFAT
ncbi:hypothetical protein ANN_02202 [Periplaneta americana]|uniref:Uncharacterized protein n=1 Tax=Periplaneta americana TaxID=6978 RepID=A0ABQ8TXE5_PERAM|nr:hypothetical protein ANN_02202 [Periplaneta americana]